MTLQEFIDTSETVGSQEALCAGIDEIYLVPLGDSFSTFLKPEVFNVLPTLDAIPKRLEMEIYKSQFTSRKRSGEQGTYYENALGLSLISDTSSWLKENEERRFWIIALMGGRWIITGDESMPYWIENDYELGNAPGQRQGWDVTLRSDQLRPYFVYIEPPSEGGEGGGGIGGGGESPL
jgi:hypothetical protein